MGRELVRAALLMVVTLGRSSGQTPDDGRQIRLEASPTSERRVYGSFQGLAVKSLLPREEELARRLFPAGPGGGAVTLETAQTLFSTPGEGPPSDGNGVLLTWGNLGAGEVNVFVDGNLLGTLPAGTSSAIVTGLEANCDPKSDPGCTANLPAVCTPSAEFDTSVDVHLFKVESTSGSSQVQCQQVLPTVPVFTNISSCLRLDLAGDQCTQYFENHFCSNRLAVDGGCDIIVGGSNDGPEGSYLEVFVDDKSAFKLTQSDGSELFCFEKSAPAGTRGTHQVRFERAVFRDDASVIFWNNPAGGFFNGLVGAFTGEYVVPDPISTTCGKPKAPKALVVRQVSYGAGKTNELRASWLNGEDPYSVGINVFLDGAKVGSKLSGDSTDTTLAALSSGNHQFDVQGDSGLSDGPSDKTGLATALKATAPFPAVVFGNLTCSFNAAGGGKTIASWQPPAGLALIDVLVKLASGGDYFLVGSLGGDATGLTINGTAAGDAVRLQPLKDLAGNLYGLTPIDLSCGGAAGSGQLPGDMNQDRTVDLSDAVKMLSFLFLGDPLTLPCGTPTSAGNKALLDWNGDGLIDLSDPVFSLQFLFLGGPTHHTGLTTVCKPMAGCPSLCTP